MNLARILNKTDKQQHKQINKRRGTVVYPNHRKKSAWMHLLYYLDLTQIQDKQKKREKSSHDQQQLFPFSLNTTRLPERTLHNLREYGE